MVVVPPAEFVPHVLLGEDTVAFRFFYDEFTTREGAEEHDVAVVRGIAAIPVASTGNGLVEGQHQRLTHVREELADKLQHARLLRGPALAVH